MSSLYLSCLESCLASCLAVFATLIAMDARSNEITEPKTTEQLRVCADPDNLPYSDEQQRGFENKIAAIVADELHASLHYDWLPQRRGFVRKTLGEGRCDVFIGVPVDDERLLTTQPYYRSSYVTVTRSSDPAIHDFSSAMLRRKRVGVQLIGDDLATSPPGYALTQIGATDNVTGYTIYGESPAASRAVSDVANRTIDVAILWGPQGSYFAHRAPVPLTVTIASPPNNLAAPFEYSIAMGVQKRNRELRDVLDAVLVRRRVDIDAVLASYHVPRIDGVPISSNGAHE
jgi:mxaJ protein